VLGRFAADPSAEHWKAIKHLLRYLVGTSHYSLPIVSPSSRQDIVVYADADHAGDADASKSTSGWMIYHDGGLIMWRSRKQSLVAQSTMEAELIATAEAWRNAQWLQDVIFEISAGAPRAPVTIMGDNQSSLTVLDSGFPNGSRHLRLRFHALQEAVKAGDMVLVHVSSEEQLADGLTKALGSVKHEAFVQSLGMKVVLSTILFGAESSPTCTRSRLEELKLYIQFWYRAQ
jgi:hypothetical protein